MTGVLGSVSRETRERLELYHALLLKWSPQINLVSRSTLEEAWTRHFVDSAQILSLAEPPVQSWLDLGSGGGFPGLVVAIMMAETEFGARVTLMESDQRKCVFLRTVLREVGVSATVLNSRIEKADPVGATVISARALAPLATLLSFAKRHGAPDSVALFPKGRSWEEEIAAARTEWRFKHTVHRSNTDGEAVILRIEEIEHV